MAPIQDPPMPKYQCHKVVSALKIFDVLEYPDGGYSLQPHDPRFAPVYVNKKWVDKRIGILNPDEETKGYFVVYGEGPDAYTSWSPIDAFENGYTLIG